MKKKLCEISEISQGSILTRIKGTDDGIQKEAITLQALSYYNNMSDEKGEKNLVCIDRKRIENAYFTKEEDLLVGLNSGKAMVIEREDANKLVLSNFFRIRINNNNEIDPYYLCWLLNANKDIKRAINANTQGSSRVMILPLDFFRVLEIKLLPIEKQKKIGLIYDLQRRRLRIRREKERILQSVYNQLLIEIYRK